MEELLSYVKPELAVLIPALYALGEWLKKSPLADWLIPFLLCAFGVGISFVYLAGGGADGIFGWLKLIFSACTQGVICASCSVLFKNLQKQNEKREGEE